MEIGILVVDAPERLLSVEDDYVGQQSRLILRFGGLVGKYHPKPLCGRQLWRDFGLSNYLI